jgi:DNA-binding response OmpR family regulator
MGEIPHGKSPDRTHGFSGYDGGMNDNNPPCAGASATTEACRGTDPPHRILVVDDDLAIRQLHTSSLLRCGYEVDAAEDGAAAWEALGAATYDLLLTDNTMPKVSGVELLKKLRAARMSLPVIMATGSFPQEEFTRYPWLRPAATLLKPYTIAEMLRKVAEVLRATVNTPEQLAPQTPQESESAYGSPS